MSRAAPDRACLPCGTGFVPDAPRRGGESGPRVRIARLLDDVADKKPVLTYPRARVDTAYGPVEAGPYYTRDNDLSVSVTACPSPQ
ncbi:hypothetical protein [Streptomyces sp. SLBN-8D4]|uniref:hypothetical protein n=1 Tax=Streptomyces sp. SLBN-8D4 TaxID=3377728 RepID=UPI003C7A70B9